VVPPPDAHAVPSPAEAVPHWPATQAATAHALAGAGQSAAIAHEAGMLPELVVPALPVWPPEPELDVLGASPPFPVAPAVLVAAPPEAVLAGAPISTVPWHAANASSATPAARARWLMIAESRFIGDRRKHHLFSVLPISAPPA
jgi:hypothetical protein